MVIEHDLFFVYSEGGVFGAFFRLEEKGFRRVSKKFKKKERSSFGRIYSATLLKKDKQIDILLATRYGLFLVSSPRE